MSNYNIQYKEYYNKLRKKHNIINSQSNVSWDDSNFIYGMGTTYKNNRKYKKESFFASLISMQLVGTMMLFLLAFGSKHSSNQDIRRFYTRFKYGIEQEYTYVNAKAKSNELKIDSIKSKILESVDLIKDKLVNDNFKY